MLSCFNTTSLVGFPLLDVFFFQFLTSFLEHVGLRLVRLRDNLRQESALTSTNSAASCSERSVRTDVPLDQLIDAQLLNQLVNVPVASVTPQSDLTEPPDLLTNYTTPVRTEYMINFVEIKSDA